MLLEDSFEKKSLRSGDQDIILIQVIITFYLMEENRVSGHIFKIKKIHHGLNSSNNTHSITVFKLSQIFKG